MQNNLFPEIYFTTKVKDYSDLSQDIKNQVEDSFQDFQSFMQSRYVVVVKNYQDNPAINEAETRRSLIDPVLKFLGYHHGQNMTVEEPMRNQGNTKKLDYFAYSDETALQRFRFFQPFEKDDFVLIEAKDFHKPLDNKKANEENPHFQIIRYSDITNIPNGILTNGYTFRFYDNSRRYAQKTFYEITLEEIAQYSDSAHYYAYFYSIFAYDQLVRQEGKASIYEEKTKPEVEDYKQAIKEQLTDILYGVGDNPDSVIENVGLVIYRKYPDESMKDIFHNSLIFIFRILFMASYESKYQDILRKHSTYRKYSILNFMDQAQKNYKHSLPDAQNSYLWEELRDIFRYLNEGSERYHIPLLNGGLFSPIHAPLLTEGLFQSAELWDILTALLYDKINVPVSPEPKKRLYDFASLDTLTFGEIYEVSLRYDFRVATDLTYLVQYTQDKQLITRTLDSYDYESVKTFRYKNFRKVREYHPGDLYLTSLSGERKRTGSYYTPEVFSAFLVKNAIESQLQKGKNPLDLKIMDNACGSGHFLIYSLDYLTQKIQDILIQAQTDEATPEIRSQAERIGKELEEEKIKITQNIQKVAQGPSEEVNHILLEETADSKILRRLILKRCLFGVDIQPIAVEITMISLWLETFIFATPLSFIEHHIKVGNSLIYTSIHSIEKKANESAGMFISEHIAQYKRDMQELLQEISSLKDTTAAEIKESKGKFTYQVLPKIQEMKAIFDFFTYQDLVLILAKKDPDRMVKAANLKLQENRWHKEIQYLEDHGKDLQAILKKLVYLDKERDVEVFNRKLQESGGALSKIRELVIKPEWREKWESIQKALPWFNPFHLEIEFPDVPQGFDIITGNPPWDKVRFEEDSFYSNLDTSYRKKTHQGKREIRERYAATPWVQDWLAQEKTVTLYNIYLQEIYPLTRGGGEGNLFRYFVARNIEAWANGGALAYLTPSALMMDDASTPMRKYLLEHTTVDYFYQFQNRKPFFKAVTSMYKFALWQIHNQNPRGDYTIQTRFLQTEDTFLTQSDAVWQKTNTPYSLELVKKLSPEHYSFLEIKSPLDLTIVSRAQDLFPPLTEEDIHFRRELDMTFDRELFHEWKLDGTFTPAWQKEDAIPLYQGKMIHQFHAQYAPPTYWVKTADLEQKLLGRELEKLGITKSAFEQKGALEQEELRTQMTWEYQQIRLAFREIARNTDERTIISSLIPHDVTYNNKIWAGIGSSMGQILFLQSIFNSLVFDFLARMQVELTVSKSIIMRLPCPQPSPAQRQQEPFKTLVAQSAQLQVLHNPGIFPTLEQEFGLHPRTLPQTANAKEKRKKQLQIKNDVLVAQLYGVTPSEMEYILTTFPVFNKKNPDYAPLLLQEMKNA